MRTLGPGSVSSVLKSILDVVYVVLWVVAAGAGLASLAAVIYDIDPDLLSGLQALRQAHPADSPAVLTVGLLAATGYVVGVQIIVERLRRIFATLTAGDPFHPANVGRLQAIALMLAALELASYLEAGVQMWLSPGHPSPSAGICLTTWFAVLVVLVLAEVFREGARLRREAELTI